MASHRLALALILIAGCGRVGFELPDDGADGGDGGGGTGDGGPEGTDAPPIDGALPIVGNIMFVTSTAQAPGSLGGLAGADALCNARAVAAGLPGTYVAWLSSSTVDARDRLAGSRGWQRPDGRPFVDTVADLVAGRIYYPPRLDEAGQIVAAGALVVTGTTENGTRVPNTDCADFTSQTGADWKGRPHVTTALWTTGGGGAGAGCGQPNHLYCFGTGASMDVRPQAFGARRAFVLFTSFQAGSGLAPADALCQSAADGNGLGGSFRAMLATTTASAISRFDLGGANWARIDGAVIATSIAELAAGTVIAPLNVHADGSYASWGQPAVWTGSARPDALGTDATTCRDWAMSASNFSVETGRYENVSGGTFGGGTTQCDFGGNLYCFER